VETALAGLAGHRVDRAVQEPDCLPAALGEVGDREPDAIVVMPDAPWAGCGSWYVDSQYTGDDYPGRPVETAFTGDLVRHIDATYRTVHGGWARAVGGYSISGAGALRYVLARQDLFTAALVLRLADSSARDYGAFGVGAQRFADERHEQLNYPALLPNLSSS
jgi:hypothetical protein